MKDWYDNAEDMDNEWENTLLEHANLFEPTDEEEILFEGNEEFDDVILDIDYSQIKGSFKEAMSNIRGKIRRNPKTKKKKPLSKEFFVNDKGRATISGGRKQMNKIIIPKDREVIVEGVDDFILKNDSSPLKNIGYYKGEKLKELVFTINNTSGVDFDVQLFDPSNPLDYLFNTSDNLNNRISVAGASQVSYTDVLYNILANPTIIPNARFTCTGSNVKEQTKQTLGFLNKSIEGETVLNPLNLDLNLDLFQFQSNVVLFDIFYLLNRVFIPDGMDVIKYKVLAEMSVSFCFYYKQKSIKKLMWKEARKKNIVGVDGTMRAIL